MRLIVDTNVLVAASIPEDYPSSDVARSLLRDATALVIPIVVLCEFVWVMRSRFKLPRPAILAAVATIMTDGKVVIDEAAANAGLAFGRSGGDFADGVIAFDGRRLGGEVLASFDARARREAAAAGFAVIGG